MKTKYTIHAVVAVILKYEMYKVLIFSIYNHDLFPG